MYTVRIGSKGRDDEQATTLVPAGRYVFPSARDGWSALREQIGTGGATDETLTTLDALAAGKRLRTAPARGRWLNGDGTGTVFDVDTDGLTTEYAVETFVSVPGSVSIGTQRKVTFPDSVWEAIGAEADRLGVSRGDVVRLAVSVWLGREQ